MKKRILSVWMALCMVLSLAPTMAFAAASEVKVAGIVLAVPAYYSVSDGSTVTKLDARPEEGETGYVHWDRSKSILTLYGVTIDGGDANSGIYANGDFTIILAKNTVNTVTSGFTNAITCDNGSVTIKGAGELNATGKTNGIETMYAVTIEDGANVTVTGNNGSGIVHYPTIFSRDDDPVKIGTDVTAVINGKEYGITNRKCDGGGAPVIESINVTITGGTAAFGRFPDGKTPTLGSGVSAKASENIDGSNPVAYKTDTYSIYRWFKTAVLTKHTVSFEKGEGAGTMESVTVTEGDTYSLPACGFTAPEGKQFKCWKVDGTEYNPGQSFTVWSDTTVNAIWENTYVVTVTNGTGGGDYIEGASVTITAGAPESGKQFEKWTGADDLTFTSGSATSAEATFTMPAQAVTVTATYKDIPATTYTVSFAANGGTGTMDPVTVTEGEYTVPACGFTAPEGKVFFAWNVNGKPIKAGEKITIDRYTLVADWVDDTTTPSPTPTPTPTPDPTPSTGGGSSKPQYTAKVDKDADLNNGDISFSRTKAKAGSTVTITVTPDAGYVLDKLAILDKDGDAVAFTDNGDGTFTFEMPKGGVEVVPEFVAETPAPEKEPVTLVLFVNQLAYLLDGEPLVNDVAPIIKAERTTLPIRLVAETLGAKVDWSEADQTVTITKDDMTIVIYIGQGFALVNGDPVELDCPAYIANSRTYLPVRFVSENLGAEVTWGGADGSVTIVVE